MEKSKLAHTKREEGEGV